MRFLTVESKGAQRQGLLLDDGRIVDLTAALAEAREQGALTFKGPVPVDLLELIQAGATFLHAAKALAGLASSGELESMRLDPAVTQKLDYEVELAVAIGRGGRDIPAGEAASYIFGYTIANDVTARDLQRRHDQWFKGKGLDGTCPMGPHIVTPDELPDVGALSIGLTVNGERRQDGDLEQMIWKVPEIVPTLSGLFTLAPGDPIYSGTPAGVGAVARGDRLTGAVEGVGEIAIQVA